MDVKRIIKEYYGKVCAHKFCNLDEMNQFLQRHNLPKLLLEEIENVKNAVTTWLHYQTVDK